MKCDKETGQYIEEGSLPVRGAWIEMALEVRAADDHVGRSPCGERGLKWHDYWSVADGLPRRSPCGERGLKLLAAGWLLARSASLPVRGAWIEINSPNKRHAPAHVAPRAGSVD